MALSKRITFREIVVNLDTDGAFASATRIRSLELLEDGEVIAERRNADPLTLAQLKTVIAGL